MKIKKNCKYDDCCDCGKNKASYCQQCSWYWGIDSGYGYCKAEPSYVLVPWCRDICIHFKIRGNK